MKLARVRDELARAVAAIADGKTASDQLALQSAPKSGAYRDKADEGLASLHARVGAGTLAEAERARLRVEETELLKELERIRTDLEAHGVRRLVAGLDQVPTASPCGMRWDQMNGDGDVRTCTQCKKIVRNLQGPPADQIALPTGEGPWFRRSDGTLVGGDCAIGARERRWASVVGLSVLAAAAVIVGVAVFVRRVPPPASHGAASALPSAPASGMEDQQMIPAELVESPSLHDVRAIEIRSIENEQPGYKAELRRRLDGSFDSHVRCYDAKGLAHTDGETSAAAVSALVAAINAQHRAPNRKKEPPCDHLEIDLAIEEPEGEQMILRTACEDRWTMNGAPLEPGDAGAVDLDAAYA
ncbi:MAG TPA: hypothetical protein VF407_10545, partial [Polyangiaceae bacterium]